MQFFELDKIDEVSLQDDLRDNYNNLPADRFLKNSDQFRKRRYGTGKVQQGIVTWDYRVLDFKQTEEQNNYVGGMQRQFEPIEFKVQNFIAEKIILNVVNKHLPMNNYSFGVHQIRITASEDYMGKPAPEGPHQDGFDYISITCVNFHNVAGGNSLIVDIRDNSKVFYDSVLDKGDTLIVNDRKLAHYASPIVPKLPGLAYRDVLVVTYNAIQR